MAPAGGMVLAFLSRLYPVVVRRARGSKLARTDEPTASVAAVVAGATLLGALLTLATIKRPGQDDLAAPVLKATPCKEDAPRTTVAFSGGGIRAATFALGRGTPCPAGRPRSCATRWSQPTATTPRA